MHVTYEAGNGLTYYRVFDNSVGELGVQNPKVLEIRRNPKLRLLEDNSDFLVASCIFANELHSSLRWELLLFRIKWNKGGKFLKKLWCCVGGRV